MNILDIAISTEQNWANVQSILGRPGPVGAVLWIESPLARERAWSRWSSELLCSSGCQEILSLDDEGAAESDPAAFQRQVREALAPYRQKELHLHLNGGTKLMQVALVDLLGQDASLHYSSRGLHHSRPRSGAWVTQVSQLVLTFEALLFAYGYEHRKKESPLYPDLGWMGRQHKRRHIPGMANRLGPVQGRKRVAELWRIFTRHYRWAMKTSRAEGFSALRTWAEQPEALVTFREKSLANREDPAQAQTVWDDFLTDLQHFRPPADPRDPGEAFEARAALVLNELAPEFGVQDAASNLQIFARDGSSARAEIDHAWLLPGGVIWIFESKTGCLDRKDLEARKSAYSQCLGRAVERVLLLFPQESAHAETLREHGVALGLKALGLPRHHVAAVAFMRQQLAP